MHIRPPVHPPACHLLMTLNVCMSFWEVYQFEDLRVLLDVLRIYIRRLDDDDDDDGDNDSL